MIIGITGTNGAGKGTVVDYLVKQKGFTHFSARGFIAEELARRGLPLNRDNTMPVANELRAKYGPGYILEQLFERAQKEGGDAVLESVRVIGEAQFLKSKSALVWAVDADRRARFDRIMKRASELDRVPFEKFVIEEDRELNSTDPTKQNMAGVMAMADTVLTNNGSPEELYKQVEEALKK